MQEQYIRGSAGGKRQDVAWQRRYTRQTINLETTALLRRFTPCTLPVMFAAFLGMAAALPAQEKPSAPAPDVLVFSNGDQLSGTLVSAADGKIVFKSAMAGVVTVSFDKVRELRSGAKPEQSGTKPEQFALIRKGVVVTKATVPPEGEVSIAGGQVSMSSSESPAASPTPAVPLADVSLLVPKAEFDKQVLGHENFFSNWTGVVTGGATLARSTTSATTLTAGINLVRAIPTVAWLPARNRTTLDLNESYGKSTSPGTFPLTSSIFHGDAERDQYLSARFYLLGDVDFDHNFAQGLALQQVYGAGAGWTAVKTSMQTLDFKADIHFERQSFSAGLINGVTIVQQPSLNLVGATLAESYRRMLPRKMVFTESIDVLPAFDVPRAYSANAAAAFAIPVFKRLSASIAMTDSFLNDPAPPLQKNSYQLVTGITYAF
jgi:hypothetical protein